MNTFLTAVGAGLIVSPFVWVAVTTVRDEGWRELLTVAGFTTLIVGAIFAGLLLIEYGSTR